MTILLGHTVVPKCLLSSHKLFKALKKDNLSKNSERKLKRDDEIVSFIYSFNS